MNVVSNKDQSTNGPSGKSQILDISVIRCDCGTQVRASIDETTVAEYADAMKRGMTFPDVIVFYDGDQYLLADGFHRLVSCSRVGQTQIRATVFLGNKSAALKFALGANVRHGLRRSNADKRRAVELALGEWPQLSDRQLAEICGVSNNFVGDVRRQVSSDYTCASRIGADGKVYSTPDSAASQSGILKEDSPRRVAKQKNPEELKAKAEYQLNLVQADADIVLKKIEANLIEPDELSDCAVQLRFAAKSVEALKASMEWPGIKQSTPKN